MNFWTARPLAHSPAKSKGFTLVEMMIVVAIVGILSAIAYPNYSSYVRKSRRSDAVAAMSRVQQAQERWRANNATYASNTQMTTATTATPPGLGLSATTDGGYYTLAISEETATAYTLTATAVSGKTQASDSGCTPLSITVSNGTPTYNQPTCWSK